MFSALWKVILEKVTWKSAAEIEGGGTDWDFTRKQIRESVHKEGIELYRFVMKKPCEDCLYSILGSVRLNILENKNLLG